MLILASGVQEEQSIHSPFGGSFLYRTVPVFKYTCSLSICPEIEVTMRALPWPFTSLIRVPEKFSPETESNTIVLISWELFTLLAVPFHLPTSQFKFWALEN